MSTRNQPRKVPRRVLTDGSERWSHLRSANIGDKWLHEQWLKNEEAWFRRRQWRRAYRWVVLRLGGRP